MNEKQKFEEKGFLLQKKIFDDFSIEKYLKGFDEIVLQLERSDEDINARWGSKLTKNYEQEDSLVIHTHNVQSYSGIMLEMVMSEVFLDAVETILGPNIILHHTKLFQKPPQKGSAFPLHQDWSYFPTENNTMIAAVIHLSPSTEEMGCFRIVPESHKLGQIENSDGYSFVEGIHDKYSLEDAKPIIAERGDVLFFHCCSLHGSFQNLSQTPRKTILVQLYSGNDRVIKGNQHTNVQLALRGRNYYASRHNVDS